MAVIIDLMMNLIASEIEAEKAVSLPNTLDERAIKALYSLSARQDMAHILGASLVKNNLLDPESEIGKAFEKEKLKAIFRRQQINAAESRICRIFEEAGIEYIPLKGAVIRKLYPEEWMRTSCDVDILVCEEQLEKAISLLTSAGFKDEGRDFHDHHFITPEGVHFELHFSIEEKNESADRVLKRVWEELKPVSQNAYCRQMNDEFLIFYSIAHAGFHFVSGGCGIRQLADVYLMKKKLSFNEDYLFALLHEAGLTDFYKGISTLIEVWFGKGAHDEITEKMEKFIVSGGTFGTKENAVAAGSHKQGGKFKYILSRIFLPAKDLKVKYPKLKKYPILLPYYQICRWCNLLKRKGVSEAAAEFSADSGKEFAEMFKKLGF
jgi:hypothetical protein